MIQRQSVGRVVAALAVLAGSTLLTAPEEAGAGAANAGDAEYEEFIADGNSFSFVLEARGYGPYAHIPYQAYNGSPYARAELASVPGRCFSFGSQYYGDQYGEEFLFEGGQKSHKNPGEARAEFPETVRNPRRVEVAPFGANGPRSLADCPSVRESVGYATYSFNGDAASHVGFATSQSHSVLDIPAKTLGGEAGSVLEDLALGGQVQIKRVETWMKVNLVPNQEPTYDYRLALFEVSAGGQPVTGYGSTGLVLAGQGVSGAEMHQQFRDQVNKNAEAFKAMAAWGIEVMSPSMTNDGIFEIRSPVFRASQKPSGQEGKRGEEQGFILGEVRFNGVYKHHDSAGPDS